jgi:hypothetical protein
MALGFRPLLSEMNVVQLAQQKFDAAAAALAGCS